MPILHPYVGSINNYDGPVNVKAISKQPPSCPYCKGKTIRWGSYWRTVYNNGKACGHRIRIARIRCKECGKTTALLPQFVAPYARVVASLREHIVQQWALGRVCGVWPRNPVSALTPSSVP